MTQMAAVSETETPAINSLRVLEIPGSVLEKMAPLVDRAGHLVAATGRAFIADQKTNEDVTDLIRMITALMKKSEDLRTSYTGPLNELLKSINTPIKDKLTTPLTNAKESLGKLATAYARAEKAKAEEAALAAAQAAQEAARKAAAEALAIQQAADAERRKTAVAAAEAQRKIDEAAAAGHAEEAARLAAVAAKAREDAATIQAAADAKQNLAAEKAQMATAQSEAAMNVSTKAITRGDLGTSSLTDRWTFSKDPADIDLSKVPVEYLALNPVAVNKAIKEGARSIPGLKIFNDDQVRVR